MPIINNYNKPKFTFNDINLIPSSLSFIESRSECNVFDNDNMLPIFTAPMSSVVGEENLEIYKESHIIPIVPRNVDFDKRLEYLGNGHWVAFSLTEFKHIIDEFNFNSNVKILIDVANGNMTNLFNLIYEAKNKFGSMITIMAGNVANPKTYALLSDAGADYIRVGIGGGSGCLTTTQTSLGYPLGSLISECYEESWNLNNPAKIIADGGIKSYSDIIKAYALGADYVMLGGIFNKALESSGKTSYISYGETYYVNQYKKIAKDIFTGGKFDLYKEFYGMSTKKAQAELGNNILKTSEGVEKTNIVEYTLDGWVDNFIDYLRSAMSYTDKNDIDIFKGNVDIIFITNNSYNAINK